ncbi:succinate-semialdehyde dehydrogenase/glutarate-semialdehyde dehydrogenase [Altererythrobacter atlanticus]|uniref:Glutarate-semialdehyde dehydrogenase DavD n=1 Tax=Croceibacterium atlanticum TaxID=1267766 RepID=A0A0F7KSM0_9SPHN|nr:NAD-dependent succinate-semialdehyde dehydrogenase [Croceibacterium atlanticum]AKH42136.1 Glutarate-semialdehyde dehydrogenase DavD [Croceibacterium atlanticum]MBB5733293.1 succinate-semialdehyde dehydrogenase/glutarate-semialdehyde dehydrogenase [Croceibacterium atlanticum]
MNQARGKLDEADLLISRAYVAGEWLEGDDTPIRVEDPFTLETIAEVASVNASTAQQAVNAAAGALPAWAARPAKERGAIVRRWFELIVQHREDLARLITRENGKPMREARGEVDYANQFMEFYADEATRVLGEIIPAAEPGRRMLAEREPVGVCAAITPWNFPLAMLTRKAAPAMAAGCTMVAKPAGQTPLSALAFAFLGQEAGIPPGVFSVVTGRAGPIGEVVTQSPAVRKLTFTGSTPVGTMLMAACAPTMKRVSMELGGNAPLLIFDDADLDTAVETAIVAKFRNSGQSCIAANRIYVQDGIRDRFLSAFAGRVSQMSAGDGFDEQNDIGPLIDEAAIAKVEEHREDALTRGGRLLAGGASPGGRIALPTLLANVPEQAMLAQEETFGPLAGVIGFDTVERAIGLANDTPFGLAAYLCSQDPAKIAHVSRALETGMVGINTGLISSAHAPFGGVKMSGVGREGSHQGIEEYLSTKYICQAGL